MKIENTYLVMYMLLVLEILLGLAIATVVLALFWLYNRKPIEYSKKVEKGRSTVRIRVNKELKKLELRDKADGEEVFIMRENISKGEELEFTYPNSSESAKISIDDGKQRHVFSVGVS